MSSSIIEPVPVRNGFRPTWAQHLGVRPRGLALAREKLSTLAWDEKDSLHLFSAAGACQAQMRTNGPLVTACCADDGSAYAAVGRQGEVWWLAPDLSLRWEKAVAQRAVAVALDPFGQYLAVADSRGNLYLFDRHGRRLWKGETQRPLHHLAFVPAAAVLLGSADYGVVATYDLGGNCTWRDGLVAHIGAMAVSGGGEQIFLACFTEGLQRYDLAGKNKGRLQVSETCRLVATSFDGRFILIAGLSERLLFLDRKGRQLAEHQLDSPALAVALGALGENAVVAITDGRIVNFELRKGS